MIRKFRAKHPERMVVLPASLSPSGVPLRLAHGDVFEIDAKRVDRFIRRSLDNGDLEEITATGEKGKTK
ncbi:MAG: hypothetical protein ACRDBH_01320 [Bosea sp. (in: a-proteobacteria)]